MPNLDDLAEVQRRMWATMDGAPIDDALEAVCEALGSVTGYAALFEPSGGQSSNEGFANVDPALIALLRTEFADPETNPILRAMPRMQQGRLSHNQNLIDLDFIRGTRFYEEWWVPTGVGDHAAGLLLPSPDGRIAWVTIGCLQGRDWFDPQERSFAEAALGGIARSLKAIAALSHEKADAVVLAQEPGPSWLIDGSSHVCLNNTAALREEADGRSVRRRNGALSLIDAQDDARFSALVASICGGSSSGGVLVVSGLRGFTCLDVEPGPRYRDERTALVTLRASRPIPWTGDELQRAFDLTPREAAVVLALVAGLRPVDIAAALGIQSSSVRLYLKRVFAKTGTQGQGPLIAMLLNGQGADHS